MAHKPRVLILGGLNVCAPALLNFLVPDNQEPLVSAVLVADKYSVHPPTTYLGSRVKKTLQNPIVRYRQANLTNPTTVASYVFDFAGEIRYDRSDEIHLSQTTKLVQILGLEAAKRKVRAYGVSSERDPIPPAGVRGYWWHEAARALAAIPDLNLVVLRCAATYGPQQIFGTVTSRIVIDIYQALRFNTLHSEDVAAAMFHAANWMAGIGRPEANRLAGEVFPHFPASDSSVEAQANAVVSIAAKPVAPYFNVVDDTDTNLTLAGGIIAEVFGIKFSFYGILASVALKSMVEDINEEHMKPWTEIILTSNPPVPNTPLTAFVDAHNLAKHSVAYSNEKIKRVLGFTLRHPKFTADEVRAVIDSFREEGTWPN
ncbi:hypothetical protein BS47DRAFT_1370918 [Hydnum rufescens UP504]|uniref:Uncharacterized protein n=1 Tax=Hydnum rufescens UP504 TaxID=1448309 RepID=A0A9P6B7F6_9AGAM|nr:hypothetical protein BS47DRAFT_1370918 [Hydnum rufescens UP504]